MQHIFFRYKAENGTGLAGPAEPGFDWLIWKPELHAIVPPGASGPAFIAWWLFHYSRVFRNRDYCQLVVRDGNRLIHRSGVYPGFFRFPFMSEADLQIGATWTHPAYRGRGLAAFAIGQIIRTFQTPGRTFWYVTDQSNVASVATALKAGLKPVGLGNKERRFGLLALGAYVIQRGIQPDQALDLYPRGD